MDAPRKAPRRKVPHEKARPSQLLEPEAPAHPPRQQPKGQPPRWAKNAPQDGEFQSRASQELRRKDACCRDWQELLFMIGGQISSLQNSLEASKYPEALARKSLEPYTAGTVERYLTASRQVMQQPIHTVPPSGPPCRFPRVGPKPILKALSWLSRNAGIQLLWPILQTSPSRPFQPSQ